MENFAYVNAADVEQVPFVIERRLERDKDDRGRNGSPR